MSARDESADRSRDEDRSKRSDSGSDGGDRREHRGASAQPRRSSGGGPHRDGGQNARNRSDGRRSDSAPESGRERSGEKKPARRQDGDRRSYGDRDSRPSYGDRERRSYADRDSRPSYGDRERGGQDRRTTDRPQRRRDDEGPRTPRAVDRQSPGQRSGPPIPDDVQFSDLDREARAPLRTLSKENAETVGRHLAMVVQLIDTDPELAYEHAQAAVRSAGRVDVVREAAGLCAYRTGRYGEALRELRTVRRLNGSSEHLPIMADCERGLGRPERAISLAATPEAETLNRAARIELAIVVSGARMDLGEAEAAEAALDQIDLKGADNIQKLRVLQAKSRLFEATGRAEEAAALLKDVKRSDLEASITGGAVEDEVIVYDLFDEEAGEASEMETPDGDVVGSGSASGAVAGDDEPAPPDPAEPARGENE